MVRSNSQGYRLRRSGNETICLSRSDHQILIDAKDNVRYCKRDQGFSPTTSINTGKNSYKKVKKTDKTSTKTKTKTNKTVRFRTPSPTSKSVSGGVSRKKKTRKARR